MNDVSINELPLDEDLVIGSTISGQYGNGWDGTNDADGRVTFGFTASSDQAESDLAVDLIAYDIDFSDETAIEVNETTIGYLETTANNESASQSFTIDTSNVTEGSNILAFINKRPSWVWGVNDVSINELPPI